MSFICGSGVRRNILILLAILLLGLCLRVYDLGNESIWVDEGLSIRVANSSIFEIIEGKSVHPPLYYIILHYWTNLFGNSEFSTRFPSVIFGFLAIFMVYKIGSLIFDEDVGISGSLLLALSVFHIRYSQEVRMYSLMAFLTSLSIYSFIKLLEKKGLKVSIGYLLSGTLLMYTHYFGVFIIIAQNIYITTLFLSSKKHYKPDFKEWISLQVILLLLFTPWIGVLINQISYAKSRVASDAWTPVPTIGSIVWSFYEHSVDSYGGLYRTGSSYILFCFFLSLSLFSTIGYEKTAGKINWRDFFKSIESYRWDLRLSNVNRIYLLIVWLLTPIILPFAISMFLVPIYLTRYTIGASLAFYLLVAKGIRNINHRYVKSVIICVVISFSLVNVGGYYTEVNKEQWREVAHYIDANAQHEDLLLSNFPSFWREICFDYYSRRTGLIKRSFPEKTVRVDEENIEELGPTVEGYSRVWVIRFWGAWSLDPEGLIAKTLSESYNLSYHKKYEAIEVYLFEKDE